MNISESAKIGEKTKMGFNVIIEDNVQIGNNCEIGHNVIIKKDTIIGDNCVIADNSILGKKPLKASNSSVTEEKILTPLKISNTVTIGAGCVIYKGTILENEVFIGDMATVREDVSIGEKTIIGKGVSVENKTSIGKFVKIETESYITAMSTIEDYCFIAPEVTFTNDNYLGRTEERKKYFKGPTIKKGARIGANATVLPGITIAEDVLVAAGSVVTKDLEKENIYMGIPAKFVRKVPEDQLLKSNL